MGISKPTASFLFDKRRQLKNGKYPLKLKVYYNGKSKAYKLPYDFTEDEWKKLNNPKLRDTKLKEIKVILNYYTGEKFAGAIKNLDSSFTFQGFERVYFEDNKKLTLTSNVFDLFDQYISQLTENGQVGNAQIYGTAKKSFFNFKKRMSIRELTPQILKDYDAFMRDRGRSVSYISMNLRCLRAIYNQAISQNIVGESDYPFSRSANDGRFKIPKWHQNKRALDIEQLRKLKNHKPETAAQNKAYLFWWFSFYCNGINAKDMALLKFKNIQGDKLVFTRSKIKDMTSAEPIQCYISDEVRSILMQLANKSNNPENYIFHVLKPGLSPLEIRVKVQSFTRNINKHFKKISKALDFPFDITTYHARHSFATFLKNSNESISLISELLGHASIETTKNYLKSFNDENIERVGRTLTNL